MSDAPADTVGRFEVEKVLGEGGMGRVVLARDPLLGRRVAVKTLLSASPDAGLRFAEEAQITGQLAHPNVIPVHAFGSQDGTPYLAMRFVQGRDLKALVKGLAKKGEAAAYPIRRRLRLFLKVCEAVAYAHQRGVIHRDLKPANVMLGDDDEVLVMDWGLARPIGATDERGATRTPAARVRAIQSAARAGGAELTQQGAVVGTPAYMPPEQAGEGGQLDARADVYSLGALLYELLTHRQPYNGSGLEVIAALITGKPPIPRPREVAPRHEIPPAVEAIVLKAMSREPDDRYDTAAELAQDIEAFLDERPVSCHREGAREALTRLVSRHRVPLAAAAAGVVVLMVASAASFVAVGAQEQLAVATAARADEEATRAEQRRELATEQARLAGVRAAAASSMSQAARRAGAFASVARTALPTGELRVARDVAAREVDALVQAVQALGRPDPARAAEVAGALEQVRRARAEIDVAFGRALVARRPRLALKVLPELEPGAEGPLLEARAHLKLEDPAAALAALERGRWAGRPELEAAAQVVSLLAADAPTEKLVPAVEAALVAARGTPWLLGLRAGLRVREGRLADAAADYERALTLDPTDASVHVARRRDLVPITIHFEFYGAAFAHFVEMLTEDESAEGEVHGWLVNLWHYRWHEATFKQIEETATAGKLTRVEADRAAAEAALIARLWPEAERRARAVLVRVKDDRRATAFLGLALVEQGRRDDARQVADAGLRRHPTDPGLAYARGSLALEEEDAPRAVELLRLAARASIQPQVHERFARACVLLGTEAALKEGVATMREGLRHDVFDSWLASDGTVPFIGDPRYHRTLGDLRRKQGDLAAAALQYHRSLTIYQTNPRAQARYGLDLLDALRLGEVHEEMGLIPEARMYYEMARQDPKLADEAGRRIAGLEGR